MKIGIYVPMRIIKFLILFTVTLQSSAVTLQATVTCKDLNRQKSFTDEAKLRRPYDFFYHDIVNITYPNTFEKVTLISNPFPVAKRNLWNIMFECYYAHLITPDPEWEIISTINPDWKEQLNDCNTDLWEILEKSEVAYHGQYLTPEVAQDRLSIVNKDIKQLEDIEKAITAYFKKKLGMQGRIPALGKAGVNEQDWMVVYSLSIALQMALGELKKALTKFATN